MTRQQVQLSTAVASTFIGGLFLIVGFNSLHWIGTTFPGFFLLGNRVVPSIALSDWKADYPVSLFQNEVVAVDGIPADSAREIYRRVKYQPPGTPITYTLRKPNGDRMTATVPARRFSTVDYALTIGALTVTGLVFAVIGLCAFLLKPDSPASLALLAACLSTGVFAITAGDLYGPHWFFRLHVLGETFMAPAFMHLALVFPRDRLRRHRRSYLTTIYLPFVGLGLYYEWALGTASLYTPAHLTATAVHGIAIVLLVFCMASEFFRTSSALIRRRIGIVAFGTCAGVIFPGALMAVSAAFGGELPVNAGVLTAFLFPLSVGYAILKHDLFEIDTILRRSLTYTAVVLVMTAAYLVGLFVIGSLFSAHDLIVHAPATNAVLNLGLLLFVAPAREKVQHQVDRLFFRAKYNPDEVLAELSQRLAAARALDDVIAPAIDAVSRAFGTRCVAIFQRQGDDLYFSLGASGVQQKVRLPNDLAARLESGKVLARYEWDDGSGRAMPALWQLLDAEIIVPMRTSSAVVAILVLGGKGSGYAYTNHDLAFLRTLASQVVLAMGSATAFARLEHLKDSLEQQVADRTVALHNANAELNESLAKLQHAYELLERNQASLLRADRLATLGRLATGLAHEINTPLGAVLNSLKIITDLGREYESSIGDASVLPHDHTQIAAEILTATEAARTWTSKAAAFLARTKLHGRELHPDICEPFALQTVVDETSALLAHRLRAAACSLDYTEEPHGIVLEGNPGRLGQVLVNLIGNAIDAYEDSGADDRHIQIVARCHGGQVQVSVQDSAGGILPTVLPYVFDELFTTKEAGKGTGLGLWIARNLIEQSFQGSLSVDSQVGVGSCFTFKVPLGQSGATAAVEPLRAVMR